MLQFKLNQIVMDLHLQIVHRHRARPLDDASIFGFRALGFSQIFRQSNHDTLFEELICSFLSLQNK